MGRRFLLDRVYYYNNIRHVYYFYKGRVKMGLTRAVAIATVAVLSVLAFSGYPAFSMNVLSNSGFEQDWNNTRPEIMSCPVEPREKFGQADGIPDGWNMGQCVRTNDAHNGKYAVKMSAGQTLEVKYIGYAIQVNAPFKAVPLKLSLWAKGVGANSDVELAITIHSAGTGEILKDVKPIVPAGEWISTDLEISAKRIEDAIGSKGKIAGAIYANVSVQCRSGTVIIDDVMLDKQLSQPVYTLVQNAGFEQVDGKAYPLNWEPVKKSMRHIGSWYYVWRSWYHFMSVPRGENAVDKTVVATGKNSFRISVPPGDHKYIQTDLIALNQPSPQKMAISFDYNSYILANLIINVVDENGKEIFFDYISSGTTGGWQTYQREFMPTPIEPRTTPGGVGTTLAVGNAVAIKNCRVRITVRGANGSNHDDINQWINVNHGGTLWIDNIALLEVDSSIDALKERGVKAYEMQEELPVLTVENIDLGERLYGENVASVSLINNSERTIKGRINFKLSGPYREEDPKKAGYAIGTAGQEKMEDPVKKEEEQIKSCEFTVPPIQRVVVTIPYEIKKLLDDWRYEYRASIDIDGTSHTTMTFGTWSQQVLVEVEKCYLLPNENPQLVSLNFGVARNTLEKTKSTVVELRRAKDNSVISSKEIPDFKNVIANFNIKQLPDVWQGDNTNFYQTTVDVSSLTVHPQTHPVRDCYVYVKGTGMDGKILFEGNSPRFGRMSANTELLEPIKSVEISEDNYLLINGKPFFNRGHIQMQQNFGPSAYSRKQADFKSLGFNTMGVGRRVDPEDAKKQGLYLITTKIKDRPPMDDATKADIQKLISHPNLIGINFVEWEAAPVDPSAEANVQYSKDIKELIGTRPLWVSAGWYSPTVNGIVFPCYLNHDMVAPENNSYFQPSQLDKEFGAKKKERGERYVLNTYPNVFNDLPWTVQRFEHWTEIIRGHTGYTIIGIPGDNTLFRGMNGEMRFFETFMFSKEKTPKVEVSENIEYMVRKKGKSTFILATNAGPVIGGDWKWSTEIKDKGKASHTGDALWSRLHNYMKDYHSHFYKDAIPVKVKKGDKIIQYAYIPADAKVNTLILMVRGNGDWMYQATWGDFNHKEFTEGGARLWIAKDMHQMFWGTLTTWGDNDPMNANLLKYVFTENQFHKIGTLPEKGKWVGLEIPVEKLGLEGKVIDGFGFVSKGDNAWWERTVIVQDGKENVLLDGSVGVSPENLKNVKFYVDGLKAGARVKVHFDEREIIAKDGYFEDDLSGEPGYQNLWVGIYGDKFGDTGYYGDGVFYNYNWGRIAARLYEIE